MCVLRGVTQMEYLAEKKAKKKTCIRLKQLALLQGKKPPRSAIKEIQAEEMKYIRDRFTNPKILEIVKKKEEKAASMVERRQGGW